MFFSLFLGREVFFTTGFARFRFAPFRNRRLRNAYAPLQSGAGLVSRPSPILRKVSGSVATLPPAEDCISRFFFRVRRFFSALVYPRAVRRFCINAALFSFGVDFGLPKSLRAPFFTRTSMNVSSGLPLRYDAETPSSAEVREASSVTQ